MTRIVVVDDQAVFRQGLVEVLEAEGLEVVAQAENGRDALRVVANTKPDVVLMDVRMPVMDGLEATRRLAKDVPSARVVVLTTFDEDQLVFEMLREGAVGYLLKGAPVDDVVSAIKQAARGASVIAPEVAKKVVTEFARLSRLQGRESRGDFDLSSRELEVLRLMARGSSNKEIALALDVAVGTVKNHITNIFAKLDVGSRTHAALKAREHGLV